MIVSAAPHSRFPLVGRESELEVVTSLLEQAEDGRGATLFLAGEGGVGKTRLATAIAERASQRGWTVALGRAYPVETGVPYAAFSDAFLPLLRGLDSASLTTMTRGGYAELVSLFPALAAPGSDRGPAVPRGDSAELKTRLLWNFSQFLGRFSAKQPLLVVLENLHWADASSLELLHFVARQISAARVALLCTYNPAEREHNPTLRATEQSLVSMGSARLVTLAPLSRTATDKLVHSVFGVDESVTKEFSALLYGWTRGNPFFVDETLKALIEAGRLRQVGGTWIGWEIETLELPRSIRDAVVARLSRLSSPARTIADLAAVIGTRATHEMIAAVSAMPQQELLTALDELRQHHVLVEEADTDVVRYDFEHPILRDTLYSELGRARAKMLHSTVAESLEQLHGDRVLEHADELAFHFARAGARHLSAKAVKYLTAAGRLALAKHANREAANYLSAALERLDEDAPAEADVSLMEDLARARQRLGEYDSAMALQERLREDATRTEQWARLAAIERRIGLACYWTARFPEALEHYELGLSAARRAGADGLQARLQLNKGICLQELGRAAEAKIEVESALEIAERMGDNALLARVQRSLLLLYLWTGPAERAREHGLRAIALAEAAGHRAVAFQAHWAMAMLGGLTGDAESTKRHIVESERIAEELHSPVLRIWTAEIAIEYASFTGDWDAGIALAERTISLARGLGRTLVPRLLVWASIMYLGRGELERARQYIEEAWQLSGAAGGGNRGIDVHTVVPAHTGLAAYHLATGNFEEAVRIGKAGLAIADSTGYVVWAIHRLLPTIAEASLWANDLAGAAWIGKRLRRDSERLGQKLGLAWADGCDAMVAMLRGQSEAAVGLLRQAAEQLEAIPFVADAARIRRQLARALTETGDREGAMRELRRAHDVFARLGAERELQATRAQLRELGGRPPVRSGSAGAHGLTGREIDIVRLVAERKSNKEIGQALGISPRTVSTHLSNIFPKLAVASRAELTDYVRAKGLPQEEAPA